MHRGIITGELPNPGHQLHPADLQSPHQVDDLAFGQRIDPPRLQRGASEPPQLPGQCRNAGQLVKDDIDAHQGSDIIFLQHNAVEVDPVHEMDHMFDQGGHPLEIQPGIAGIKRDIGQVHLLLALAYQRGDVAVITLGTQLCVNKADLFTQMLSKRFESVGFTTAMETEVAFFTVLPDTAKQVEQRPVDLYADQLFLAHGDLMRQTVGIEVNTAKEQHGDRYEKQRGFVEIGEAAHQPDGRGEQSIEHPGYSLVTI